jgi:hypothetical protein
MWGMPGARFLQIAVRLLGGLHVTELGGDGYDLKRKTRTEPQGPIRVLFTHP